MGALRIRGAYQMADWVGLLLGGIALVCVLLPCRYDPAIRMKEWLDGNRDTDQTDCK
jgi:hypothetical protein